MSLHRLFSYLHDHHISAAANKHDGLFLIQSGSENRPLVFPFGASGFFYSLQSNSPVANSGEGIISDQNVNSSKSSNSGFEWSLGIGYDFSITHDWSIGVNYEKFMNIRGQQLVSLRARYAF